MSQNTTAGPQTGQRVLYVNSPGVNYTADIVGVTASSGLVRLTVFVPGATFSDVQNCQYDPTGNLTGSWHYPDQITGI